MSAIGAIVDPVGIDLALSSEYPNHKHPSVFQELHLGSMIQNEGV
jgi:hypothetical protein